MTPFRQIVVALRLLLFAVSLAGFAIAEASKYRESSTIVSPPYDDLSVGFQTLLNSACISPTTVKQDPQEKQLVWVLCQGLLPQQSSVMLVNLSNNDPQTSQVRQLSMPSTMVILPPYLEFDGSGNLWLVATDLHTWSDGIAVARRTKDYLIEWARTPIIVHGQSESIQAFTVEQSANLIYFATAFGSDIHLWRMTANENSTVSNMDHTFTSVCDLMQLQKMSATPSGTILQLCLCSSSIVLLALDSNSVVAHVVQNISDLTNADMQSFFISSEASPLVMWLVDDVGKGYQLDVTMGSLSPFGGGDIIMQSQCGNSGMTWSSLDHVLYLQCNSFLIAARLDPMYNYVECITITDGARCQGVYPPAVVSFDEREATALAIPCSGSNLVLFSQGVSGGRIDLCLSISS